MAAAPAKVPTPEDEFNVANAAYNKFCGKPGSDTCVKKKIALLKLKPDKTADEQAQLTKMVNELAVEQAKFDAAFDALAKKRQCLNCNCVWGLTCIYLGIVVMIFAGVFTFFPVFMQWFTWEWYEIACWAWAILGLAMVIFGWIVHCFTKKNLNVAEAREATDVHDGEVRVPVPYVMLDP